MLLVVDQPSTIGALPVVVLAQGEGKGKGKGKGIMVGYSPGLAMRRIADLHPGQAKMPGPLRLLPKQATATSNRIRELLARIHRASECVIGKHLGHLAWRNC